MKIKTNLRAGSGSDNTAPEDTSGQNRNQKGKYKATVVYTRCAGL